MKGTELLVGDVTIMHVFLNIPVKTKVRYKKPVITCEEQRTTVRACMSGERKRLDTAASHGPSMVSVPG